MAIIASQAKWPWRQTKPGEIVAEIILVRHGQANSTAQTEESYDQLSALGADQSSWLGAYFRDHDVIFDHCMTGTLNRHHQTLRSMDMGAEPQSDPRLNELDYFALADGLQRSHGVPPPAGPSDFATHLPIAMAAWEADDIAHAPEAFRDFEARIATALHDALALGGRTLIVTSGGVIGMAVRAALGLDIPGYARIMLATFNSSVHRFVMREGRLHLSQFNAVPHLEHPDRAHARTFI